MKLNRNFFLFLSLFLGIFYTEKALSHGASINYQETKAINIKATYDNGEPIKNGQVTIYNPTDPANSWLTGMTNDQGEFLFIPDYSINGNWQVKIRQAGHGGIITIPINNDVQNSQNLENNQNTEAKIIASKNNLDSSMMVNKEYTPQQKLLMAGFGVWGCIGTALYFSNKKAEQ